MKNYIFLLLFLVGCTSHSDKTVQVIESYGVAFRFNKPEKINNLYAHIRYDHKAQRTNVILDKKQEFPDIELLKNNDNQEVWDYSYSHQNFQLDIVGGQVFDLDIQDTIYSKSDILFLNIYIDREDEIDSEIIFLCDGLIIGRIFWHHRVYWIYDYPQVDKTVYRAMIHQLKNPEILWDKLHKKQSQFKNFE